MEKQKIKLGSKELILQQIDVKNKLEFSQLMVNGFGDLNLVGSIEYILNHIVVSPQGLTIEDFKFNEIQALFQHVKDFLDLEGQDVTIQILN